MNVIKCVEVSAPLDFLRPMLTTWADRVELVSQSFPQAHHSYYLEPTLVGLLSGSAWTHGMPSITEVKIQRTLQGSPNRAGRLDLLMHHGKMRIALEAKLIWDSELIPGNVLNALSTACAEVISISGNRADILLGGVFFVPWWDNEAQRQNLKSRVLDPYEHLQLDIKICCYDPAIDFPGAMFMAQIA